MNGCSILPSAIWKQNRAINFRRDRYIWRFVNKPLYSFPFLFFYPPPSRTPLSLLFSRNVRRYSPICDREILLLWLTSTFINLYYYDVHVYTVIFSCCDVYTMLPSPWWRIHMLTFSVVTFIQTFLFYCDVYRLFFAEIAWKECNCLVAASI